ncbi:MAG TPA: ABC transporter substrate-binding protein, partial [Candidatus Binatia bacterium]|nr:ABC transporter substrate-binding protein [Candidatus Binatia bacterium]
LLAFAVIAEAQQAKKLPRIGFLQPGVFPPAYKEEFRKGLRQLGYVEGENILVEYRLAKGLKELPARVAELVALKLDVVVTWTTPGAIAAKQGTKTIPIVTVSGDPVETGLVASLARPGGNVTGLAILTTDLETKKLELLKEALPGVSRIGVLWNPDNPVWASAWKELPNAAQSLRLRLEPLEVRDPGEFEQVFASAASQRAGALLVVQERLFVSHRQRIVELAAGKRLPAIYGESHFVNVGGLMSYGASVPDMLRRSAAYVDKILKGTKAAELPVEQAMKFEMLINLKAAKQIGLTIPPNVLARADKVIK